MQKRHFDFAVALIIVIITTNQVSVIKDNMAVCRLTVALRSEIMVESLASCARSATFVLFDFDSCDAVARARVVDQALLVEPFGGFGGGSMRGFDHTTLWQ